MKNKLKLIFYLSSIITFVIFLLLFYLSEDNKINTNKVRAEYNQKINNFIEPVPFLISDTQNIIYFNDDLNKPKEKKKKRKFWELIDK